MKKIIITTFFGTVEKVSSYTFRSCTPLIIRVKRFLKPPIIYIVHVNNDGRINVTKLNSNNIS